MLRADIDQDPMWSQVQSIRDQVSAIEEQGELDEQASIARIRFYLSHVVTMGDLAASNAPFVSRSMLESVRVHLVDVANGVRTRHDNGPGFANYLLSAAASAEEVLLPLGAWPRPYAQGGQVKQLRTLFEDLLEQQRHSIEVVEQAHREVADSAQSVEQQMLQRRDEINDGLLAVERKADAVVATIESQKTRVDEFIQDGLRAVDELRVRDRDSFREFRAAEEERFQQAFFPLRDRIGDDLERAKAMLAELESTNQKFANLTTAAAGDVMAGKFESEARFARWASGVAYLVALLAIALAAVPFVFLLTDSSLDANGTVEWGRIAVRAALGVILGSGAAVAIRIGGRLLAQATSAKRMELELRTFDPFLANVNERESVDAARLELIDRAFGRAYASPSDDGKSDAVEVSTLSRVLDSISKITSR